MHRFRHLLVDLTLDGTEADLIHWAEHLASLGQARQVTFLHSWEVEDISPGLRAKYPWLVEPGLELLRDRAQQVVSEQFKASAEREVTVEILEGERLDRLVRYARDEDVDLIVTPRPTLRGEGENFVTRLARKAPCAVFCVSLDRAAEYASVLVPVDYSAHSERALDFGCALARAHQLGSISVLRCFGIPWGQHRTTLTREEFRADYEDFEQERLERYLAEHTPEDVQLRGEIVENPSVAFGIANFVRQKGVDVVVLGSRGKHAASAALLGSTAESVVREVPASVLVIKPKGTGLDLLESLLSE